MARLVTAGAETKDPGSAAVSSLEGMFTSSLMTFETTVVRSGAASFKLNSGAGNAASYITFNQTIAGGTGCYIRAYVRFASLPTTTVDILATDNTSTPGGSPGPNVTVRLTTAGKIQLWDKLAAVQIETDSAVTIAVDTWYRIELYLVIATTGGATDNVELRLDGVYVASDYGVDHWTVSTSYFRVGFETAPGANTIMYVDDIAMNQAGGTGQNSWPGDGNVVLLVPTADSARATKWTTNAGTTTGLFNGVSGEPPVGIAAATSPDNKYDKHAGSAAGTTDAYDATMTTYTAAGIGAADTITLVQYLISTGEEVGTGTKLLAVAGVSNPAVTQGSNFSAGADVGAQGVFPTNWRAAAAPAAIQYAPTVTLGTAPVMRVVRPETASRVASVDFMGMYVEYVPAAPTVPASVIQSSHRYVRR